MLLSERTFDPVIDLVETTVICPCPCPDARVALWIDLIGKMQTWRDRLEVAQREVLMDIGRVLGQAESSRSLDVVPERDVHDSPQGRPYLRVFLYTLQAGVAERVGKLIRKIAPTLRLDVSSALDGEVRLRELARSADVVVICWGSATHAATNAIKSVVDPSRIRYPSGNGSSSVIREITAALRAAA
jgi:hypothetical protein